MTYYCCINVAENKLLVTWATISSKTVCAGHKSALYRLYRWPAFSKRIYRATISSKTFCAGHKNALYRLYRWPEFSKRIYRATAFNKILCAGHNTI